MDTSTLRSIEQLSVAERIQLVEDIWDSIAAAPETLDLSESHRHELNARSKAHIQNPGASSSWDAVKARLETGKAT